VRPRGRICVQASVLYTIHPTASSASTRQPQVNRRAVNLSRKRSRNQPSTRASRTSNTFSGFRFSSSSIKSSLFTPIMDDSAAFDDNRYQIRAKPVSQVAVIRDIK